MSTIAKGAQGGECNRTVCRNTDAQWFNRSTEKFYCEDCAEEINYMNFDDAQRLFGTMLCVLGPPLAGTSRAGAGEAGL